MPPKRQSALKTALNRVENGLRRLFPNRDSTPLATKSNIIYLNNTDWDGLERFGSAFGPLTSAIGRFSGCVRMFEEQARARKEYEKIGVDLNDVFHTLAEHFGQTDPASVTLDSFANLARSIDAETKLLESDADRKLRDDGAATPDVEKILRCYRRVRTLLALFAVNETAKVWKVNDDEALNTRLELLLHAPNAHYRAVDSKDARRAGCMPNTRADVLQELRDWVHYGKFQTVYWLNGIAGTGKTTIAYSLCEWLENSGKPAASFFCSPHLPDCRDVRHILPSVSYQLAKLSRPFRCAVSTALEQDPELCNRPVDEQFKRLIAEPFQNVGHTFGVDVVIVLDALDECEDKYGVNQMLDACFKDSSSLPVRFLITTRPNIGISHLMRVNQDGNRRAELRLHEADRTVTEQDVRTYLSAGLERFSLSDEDLEWLVKRSGGLFIYAASAVGYLDQGDGAGRAERLKRLLDVASCTENTDNRQIDVIYTAMLEEVLDHSGLEESRKAKIMLVLRTTVCARDSLTVSAMAELQNLDFSLLMNTSLHLLLPTLQVSDASGLGMTLQRSFSTYLVDPQRSGKFHCDGQQNNALLARLCLRRISTVSQPFNICNLDSSYLLDREVVDIDERVGEAIPQGLWYACRHWGTHLALAEPCDELLAALHGFLSRWLLVWMEIMNLKRSMPEAAELLHGVYLWLQEVECPATIRDLVLDSWKFVAELSSNVVSESTPHIYVSALRFWPPHRPISVRYMPMLRNVVNATGARPRSRGEGPMVLEGSVTRIVHSSPSFDTIARAAGNNFHPMPVGTGQPMDESVDGRTGRVLSVVYSPNGARIASGSDGKNVQIWDIHTDQPVGQPLDGHTSGVNSVAYSPDGAYFASGSSDKTVRVWNAHTGRPVGQPLKGHTSLVLSVAYSPDGAYIASGSDDMTVRIWDAQTSQPVGRSLIGHILPVNSVSYCPNGAYIVSGSDDDTVRIWDAHTGQLVGQPLTGHTGGVRSVAYSPNGAHIASGSDDMTIRIWDAHTGQLSGQPLSAHILPVHSVSYSPNGAYIVSGSYDRAVRIRDTQTGQHMGRLLNGHTGGVNSVAYSPNGACIASGFDDNAVRIWNAHTGQPVGQALNGHTHPVQSVAYSPDGAYIVSGSSDGTIRIWELHPEHGARLPEVSLQPIRPDTHAPNRSPIPFAVARFIARLSRKSNPAITSPCMLAPEELLRRWTLDDQGWVVNTRQERLIWIPQDLREFLLVPPALLRIPPGDHVILDFRDAKIGTEWRDCFDPTPLYA